MIDQDRWKEVNRIFHAALEVPASARHQFVLTSSKGDPDVQAEVELLLQADQDAGSYLAIPLISPSVSSTNPIKVRPGDELCGRFRILREIAEGGMGQVFEAFDSELGISVALKVIRPEIAHDPRALPRFRQEVRLTRQVDAWRGRWRCSRTEKRTPDSSQFNTSFPALPPLLACTLHGQGLDRIYSPGRNAMW